MGTIVILTLKEALRRRAFLGTLIILVALYGLTFLPKAFHQAFGGSPESFKMGVNLMILFGVDIIKFFSSVLAILLSAGAITSEIERGLFSGDFTAPATPLRTVFGQVVGRDALLRCQCASLDGDAVALGAAAG
jgi:ABC-type transport system involved in multi-copper enzyme maturation permease subunit